jgi:hypothetical protein
LNGLENGGVRAAIRSHKMSRLFSRLAIALAAIGAALPATAADFPAYDDSFRPAYPDDWQPIADQEPLGFEFGLRYWYSWGEDDWNPAGANHSSDDRTQFLEGHLRIDDYSTQSYVKGLAGYSVVINGDYSNPVTAPGSADLGSGGIGYAGADFGWSPFGDAGNGSGIYGLVGYQYWGEAADPNHIDIHALRLGLSARANFDMFDVSAEVAAVPYAWVNGTLATGSGAETAIDTSAYGVMGELMLGITPTPNFAARVGGRAWYLKGVTDGDNDYSLLRYGLLGELTYKF